MDKTTELRLWMEKVLHTRRWSANRWATEAGVAATTITRFLNGQTGFVPSTTTINKLVQAAGFGPTPDGAGRLLPVVDAEGLTYNGYKWIVLRAKGERSVMTRTGEFIAVVDIPHAMPRIMAGDKVVIQPCRVYDLRDGAYAAYFEHDKLAVARVVAGRMISLDGEALEQPRPEKVIGQIVQVIADLG